MRPHRLRLQAFGSFAGVQELDLDELASSGVFLLHGETGAGKSTLLDAVCFALYGRVPRHGAKGGRLRSDHAPDDVRTEVELEVTLCGRRLRLTRRPQQDRPKARGEGITTEQASVRLDELRGGVWEPVSQRLDEVGAELELLLGMTADQFQQVVLLPQGQFAAFLQADTRKRGELLERLFATERFADVEQWLAGLRSRTTAAVQTAQQETDVLAARLAQAAGVEVPAETDHAWVEDVMTAARAAESADAARATAARSEHALAVTGLDEARALAARQARRRGQLEALAGLDEQQPAVDELATRVADAARAAELVGGIAEADRREALAARAAAEEAMRRAALSGLVLPGVTAGPDAGEPTGADVDLAGAPAELVDEAVDRVSRRTGLLEGLQEQADAVAAERRGAVEATAAAATAATARERAEAVLAGLPARVLAAEAALALARAAAGALPEAEQAERDLRAALREAQGLLAVTAEQDRLREQHLRAREHAADLRERADDLRAARLDGMRAELAAALEDGDPCPVCGSADHPDLYLGTAERVTHEAEEGARAAADEARQAVGALDVALAGLAATAAQHAARLAELGLGEDPALLGAGLADATVRLHDLRAVAAGLAAAEQGLTDVTQVRDQARQDALTAVAAHEGAVLRAEEASDRADRAAAALEAHLDGTPSLEEALARARGTRALLVAAASAIRSSAAAAQEAVTARASALTAAIAAGFDDLDAVRAVALAPEERAQAQDLLRAHADARAAVVAALADPDLDVALDPPCDLAAPTQRVDATEQERAAAEAALTRSAQRARDLELLAPVLAQALDDLVPLEQEAERARSLADLCAGTSSSNALRMSLSSFVLAARLEQVAEVASQRLLAMTQGRYCLVHSDGAAGHGRRSGLGLLARDSWTGQDRDTATLSGGETFLAALALALGLADVVQQEAGGARIDALFVDEGFGTLDDQALDLAMDVLDGLRAGGRLVGVVSHVAELRARIPAQVKVHKGRDGSRLEVVGAA